MLFRKMMRDIRSQKGTYMACITIMVIGLMTFNLFSIGYDNFSYSRDQYYDQMQFAQGFARVKGMPVSEVEKLAELDEIKKIEGRLVEDVRILGASENGSAYLRLISYHPEATDSLNQFELQSGRMGTSGENQVILDSKYYEKAALKEGDTLSVAVAGRVIDLHVGGSGRSPEYIYALRTDQDLYPDPERFGIAFIPYDTMKTILRAGQSVNDIAFIIENGHSFKDAEHAIREGLESYGLMDLRERKDQKSHLLLNSEIEGMKGMAVAMPSVFLSVAAMIMIIMLKRLVEKQRGQIGVFKAFGMTDFQILKHYMGYAVVVGVVSGLLGTVVGNMLVLPFTKMYQTMFNMPLMMPEFSYKYAGLSLLVAMLFSVIAGYEGVKSTLKIEPAQAMRPPAPISSKGTAIERIHILWSKMTMLSRIAVRNIFRNKGRTGFVFIGVMLTYAILGMPWAMKENMDIMVYDQFDTVMVYDMKVDFTGPVLKKQAVSEMMQTAQVTYAESLMEVPSLLYNKGQKKAVNILGIQKSSALYHLYDEAGVVLDLPDSGMILSDQLADKIGIQVGESLLVKSPYARKPEDAVAVQVTQIIPQYLGLNAYMEDSALSALLNQPEFSTSVIAATNRGGVSVIRDRFDASSTVFGVNASEELMDKYGEMMEMMQAMLGLFVVIGIACGFSIVYASSMITLSERNRELASMLVIGLSYAEVKRVLYLEQWYTAVVAFLIGMPLLKGMVESMSIMMANDVYTMPTEVSAWTFVSAALLTAGSIVLAQWQLGRKVEKIELVEALSIRE